MSSEARDALIHLIDRYLSGERSRRLVDEIEGIVVQSFQDANWYDHVGDALALYEPGERRPYVGDSELEPSSGVYALAGGQS